MIEHGDGAPRAGRARWQAVFVWVVWIAMTLNAARYVATYGSREMAADDLWLVLPRIDPDGLTLGLLWSPHNEHRILLPKLIQFALYDVTGDVRSGNWFTVAILSAISAAMIVLAQRLRGRLSWTDALFPIIWLQTGNTENLLMGLQISLMLPTALVSLVMMVIATSPHGPSAKQAIVCGTSMVLLPLCGGPGFLQAPVLCVWAVTAGFVLYKREDPASRRAATILWSAPIATIALLVVYLVGLTTPDAPHTYTVQAIGDLCLHVLAITLAAAGERWWPWSGIVVLALLVSGMLLAVRTWVMRSDERLRSFGLLCCIGANMLMVLGIGFGRSGVGGPYGFANRYVELTTPAICAAYAIWTLYGATIQRGIVRAATCVLFASAFVLENRVYGEVMGAERKAALDQLARDVESGLPAQEIVRRNGDAVDGNVPRLWFMFSNMARLRIVPFDRAPARVIDEFTYDLGGASPQFVIGRALTAPGASASDGRALLLGHEAAAYFSVPEFARRLRIAYALQPPEPGADAAPASAQFVALVTTSEFASMLESDTRKLLLARTLDPSNVAADRGDQTLEAELPDFANRRLVLRVMVPKRLRDGSVFVRVNRVQFE